MKEEYTIGKLAKESGVTVETIRFYEQKGLIKQPSPKSGYRKYPFDDIIKIKFMKFIDFLTWERDLQRSE